MQGEAIHPLQVNANTPSWTQLGHLYALPFPTHLLLPVRMKVRARSPSASVWASYPLWVVALSPLGHTFVSSYH